MSLLAITALALCAPRPIAPAAPGEVTVDGFFDDWSGRPPFLLDRVVRGRVKGPGDLSGSVALTFTGGAAGRLFAAVQVKDDVFQHGTRQSGDRLSLRFAAGGRRHRLEVVLNDLEGAPAQLVLDGRERPKGARLIGTDRVDGWAVELSIPLRALPGIERGPVAFAAVVHDVDHDGSLTEAVVASGPIDAKGWPTEPTLRLEPAAGMYALYTRERSPAPAAVRRREGDVTGDGMAEEVVINGRDVVVAGRGLPEGAAFLYFTHGWEDGFELLRFDLMDLDGVPGKEILVERREPRGERQAEILEIYGLHDGFLKRRFAHQLAERLTDPPGNLRARFKVQKRRRRGARRFHVSTAKLQGVSRARYERGASTGQWAYEPLLLPWEDPKGAVYQLEGDVWLRR